MSNPVREMDAVSELCIRQRKSQFSGSGGGVKIGNKARADVAAS